MTPTLSEAPRGRPRQSVPTVRWGARLALGLAGALTLVFVLDAVFPPDLTRYRDRGTLVLDREGRILRAFLSRDDKWRLPVTVSAVDARYIRLLKAYEDRRFDVHPGIDPLAVFRALGQAVAGGRIVSGASTLTMQTARLLEPGSRGLAAKLRQAVRALQLEARFTKNEILAIYLTLAPFGGNLEGVRAASLAYFGKEPGALTLDEAALLVALPQSPEARRPDRRRAAARAARDRVLDRLHKAGAMDGRAHREARAAPIHAARRPFPAHAPRLARTLNRQAGVDGTVRTTLDRPLQEQIESLAAAHARGLDDAASLAVVVVENESAALRAYLGGHDLNARAGHVDLAAARRSPGSALKPFIYALAFDEGLLHPETHMEDRARDFDGYAPRNFDRRFQGTVTARIALQQSLNVPAVSLLDRLGPARLYATLREARARPALPAGAMGPGLPIALGGLGISLRDLTMLYAGLARDGLFRPLRMRRDAPAVLARRLVGPAAAWHVRNVLEGAPLPPGWGQARNIVRDRRIAFKTGTSAAFQDAWAIGFSRAYTVGVWTGRADGTARPGRIGRNTAAPVMLRIFDLLPGEPAVTGSPPDTVLVVRANADLPKGLRVFADADAPTAAAARGGAPRIVFPPDGSAVPAPHDGTLVLAAEGGRGALRWLVNGRVLPEVDQERRLATWPVDGAGYTEISVIDADGRSDQATVRVMR